MAALDPCRHFHHYFIMRITLHDLQKTYSGAGGTVAAVSGISLEIPENTVFGIIGKSGAGKSSLVRLISLLEAPDKGEVFYNGKRVDNMTKAGLIEQRRKTGMIFQNFNLFSSRTAAKNIAYPLEICGMRKDAIRERVKEMLALVGLEDRADSPVSALSGGQKQRIAIARALSTRPGILFCDEATSALDPQTTGSILSLIRSIQKQMNLTVVMITHQMEVVRDACEQVAVIDSGKVVEQGTVKDIFSRPESAVTKELLRRISGGDFGEGENLVRWSQDGGKYVLRFVGEKTGEPVLSRLAKRFDIDFNIRAGGIQHLADDTVGAMLVDFTGEQSEIKKAVDFLTGQGVIVEETE